MGKIKLNLNGELVGTFENRDEAQNAMLFKLMNEYCNKGVEIDEISVLMKGESNARSYTIEMPKEHNDAKALLNDGEKHFFLNAYLCDENGNEVQLIDFATNEDIDFTNGFFTDSGCIPSAFIKMDENREYIVGISKSFFEIRKMDMSNTTISEEILLTYMDDFKSWDYCDIEYLNAESIVDRCVNDYIGEGENWEDLKNYDDYNDDYNDTPSSVAEYVDWNEYFENTYDCDVEMTGGYFFK